MVELNDLGGAQHKIDVLTNSVRTLSAFQAASRQIPIQIGVENTLITGLTPHVDIVGEGEKKPVGGVLRNVLITPKKLAGFLIATTESLANADIEKLLEEQVPNQLAAEFDAKVATGQLGTLADAEEVPLTEWADLHTVLSQVRATAFVASSGFAARLLGFKDATGREYLPQTQGLQNILGVPVHIYQGAEPAAWVGDFRGDSAWGAAAPQGGTTEKFKTGTLEVNGEEVNLLQQNVTAYRVEAYFAFGARAESFRKITIPGEETGE